MRLVHEVPTSVKAANLRKWFPPSTVSRDTWHETLKVTVSGVSTDVLLFSQCGMPLIHHYRVLGRGGVHASLRGNYMS